MVAVPAYPNLDQVVAELRDLRVHSNLTRSTDGLARALPSRTATEQIVDGVVGGRGVIGERVPLYQA
jgi:hypothetical protein